MFCLSLPYYQYLIISFVEFLFLCIYVCIEELITIVFPVLLCMIFVLAERILYSIVVQFKTTKISKLLTGFLTIQVDDLCYEVVRKHLYPFKSLETLRIALPPTLPVLPASLQ